MEKVNGDTNRAEGAGLPREELGPFLLLGVNKEAGADRVDARWAERVREARQGRIGVPVQDLHWAHDVLCDTDRRVNADVTSWNLDTAAGTLRSLEEAYGLTATGPAWTPLDVERPPAADVPAADIPDADALRQAIALPPIPGDVPGVEALLRAFAREPLDPWGPDLAGEGTDEE